MTENLTVDYFKPVIEGLLFISDKPVMIDQVKDVLKTASIPEIKKALLELKEDYDETTRGMTILEIAGGYQMLSSPHYASYIRDFFKRRVKEKLSRPALETLAIIAYKQPVSRGDIELIRGVNSDGVTINLLEKGLIKVMGRKDVPGRPYLYGTTKLFLEYFGLKSLRDLPKLGDFPALALSVNEASEGGGLKKIKQQNRWQTGRRLLIVLRRNRNKYP
ncbi:MAG: SMC-Scp complex subunit ScpB [Candidatus Omnitrophica bacterium]|nr:SMC-Scp complex subunit ScpB [Candidatus Omnitrophota bacterium]